MNQAQPENAAIQVDDRLLIRPPLEDLDIEPLDDLVLLEAYSTDETTKGGIIVPEQSKEGLMPRWKVLKFGPGVITIGGNRVGAGVTEGDLVVLSPARGNFFEIPNRTPRRALVEQRAILAVVRPAG